MAIEPVEVILHHFWHLTYSLFPRDAEGLTTALWCP